MKTKEKDVKRTTGTDTVPRAEYDELKSGYDRLKSDYEELESQYQWLLEKLNLANKKMYGSSSEKISGEDWEQMSVFDEPEAIAFAEEEEQKEEIVIKAHTRKKTGSVKDVVPEDIRVEVIEHSIPEDELVCPQCGEQMAEIGREVKRTLVLVPADAYIREDVYYTYACQKCNKEDTSTPVVKTPQIPALIPGGFASPEAVAHIAVQKYVMGSPLYRQEQEWNRRNIFLSRQTMANWLICCAENWLGPVYDTLRQKLLKHDIIHSDETSLQVLHEPGKKPQSKSSMWLYRTGSGAEHPIVLYEYQPGKSGDYPKDFLQGFQGYLQTDGASYYNAVEGVVHVGCWAHLRRKFEDARAAMPKGKRSPTAETGVSYCTKLFNMERSFQDLTPEERRTKRLEQEKPVLDAMLAWANTRSAAPKSKLGEALTYLQNQWQYLSNYLLDGRLELSNNRAERSIKPFVMSRKNFLFANTPKGARGSAVFFSLIVTALENGLDPYKYLTWVLKEAPILKPTDPDWVEKLIPENAPDNCKATKE